MMCSNLVAGCLAVGLSGAVCARCGVLIEAEEVTRKTPADKTFAVPARDGAASGRRVLHKFYVPGTVFYTVELPEAGLWHGWVRYGAKQEQTLRVAIDPGEEVTFTDIQVPPTGGYIGRGVWGWARLFSRELTAGSHVMAVGHAALRLDCFYLTRDATEPTDGETLDMGPREWDEKTLARARAPYVPVRPDWLEESAGYRLPAWYDRWRICLHTRLSPGWMERDVFFNAAAHFRDMGAHVFVRHIKTGSEGAWWPSAVGAVHPLAEERNIAAELIGNAHRAGCRILVYHRHMEDAHLAAEHPDWQCVDPDGEVYTRRGPMLCFNSPYADVVKTRLLELVDMGADGFYFDEVHMPKPGCWCPFCQARFKDETGLAPPDFVDERDPVWNRYYDFKNVTIERTFLAWRRALHQRNPEVVLLIGSNTYPTLNERHTTQRLYRIADSMKTEFTLPLRAGGGMFAPPATMTQPEADVKIALGYSVARDVADGRPPHTWIHGLRDAESAVYAAAAVMAHGGIANMDVPEGTIPNAMFTPALEFGEKVSAAFAGTVPVRRILVHYPEAARDLYLSQPEDAARHVLVPFYGMYRTLLRAHLSPAIISDSQLEEGVDDDCAALFLPTPDGLTETMRTRVEACRRRGGAVIANRADWQWHDPAGFERAAESLSELLRPFAAAAPVRVSGGPPTMHTVLFRHRDTGALTVALLNDFTWVRTGRRRQGEEPLPPAIPEAIRGVRVGFPSRPTRVVEVVGGTPLAITIDGDVEVPDFGPMAVLRVTLR